MDIHCSAISVFLPIVLNDCSQASLNHGETTQLDYVCWTYVQRENFSTMLIALTKSWIERTDNEEGAIML